MVSYICETCNKTFSQKSHYSKHLNRKNPCKKNTIIEAMIEKKVNEAIAKSLQTSIIEPVAQPLSNINNKIVKPVLKWVGGKTQIIDNVLALFPTKINNYYEPFLGGGSVLFALLSSNNIKIEGKIYASDLNSNLIALYKNIQTKPDEFIHEIKQLINIFNSINGTEVNRKPTCIEEATTSKESYYYWIRTTFNKLADKTTSTASAMLLFMNKTCFRGVYREGPNGINVPYGNYKNPSIIDETHIYEVSRLIQPVIFNASQFASALENIIEGDFVYMDPPYAPENATSFVGYTSDGFTAHDSLFQLCKKMKQNCVKFLMSNSDVPLVRDAFPVSEYTVNIIECKRSINSKNPDAKTNEVLIQN